MSEERHTLFRGIHVSVSGLSHVKQQAKIGKDVDRLSEAADTRRVWNVDDRTTGGQDEGRGLKAASTSCRAEPPLTSADKR